MSADFPSVKRVSGSIGGVIRAKSRAEMRPGVEWRGGGTLGGGGGEVVDARGAQNARRRCWRRNRRCPGDARMWMPANGGSDEKARETETFTGEQTTFKLGGGRLSAACVPRCY